ncbi:MAG: PilZ domain-containing protein [Chloroflexi bacterium]|nr:PilZ domain-containing protein [Chloroflexota bacterium]
MMPERRKLSRRTFSYYMRVMDEATGKLIGHLSDISTNGFKLDSQKPIPVKSDLRLRIDQTDQISNKSYVSFSARAIWCQLDQFDPNTYNVGFQILNMTPSDYDIFLKMFNAYGMQKNSRHDNNFDQAQR